MQGGLKRERQSTDPVKYHPCDRKVSSAAGDAVGDMHHESSSDLYMNAYEAFTSNADFVELSFASGNRPVSTKNALGSIKIVN